MRTGGRLWAGLQHLWASDRGLSVFLVLLVLAAFVRSAVAQPTPLWRAAGDLAFSLMLVAGAVTASEHRWLRLLGPAAVVLGLAVRWASAVSASLHLAALREGFSLMILALFAAVVAARVYRAGAITHHRIQGAVAVYLLLGLIWASAYEALYILSPGAFTGAVGDGSASQTWIYYSFVTLTTMGYGDITPVHPLARSLAILEALTGQLYLAITIARLVALQIGARQQDR